MGKEREGWRDKIKKEGIIPMVPDLHTDTRDTTVLDSNLQNQILCSFKFTTHQYFLSE